MKLESILYRMLTHLDFAKASQGDQVAITNKTTP